MRRFRRRSFGRKRTVSWIPGAVFGGGARRDAVDVTLSPLPSPSNTNAATFFITADEDLQDSGGEDAVLTRVLYDIWISNPRSGGGTGAPLQGWIKLVVYQGQRDPDSGNVITPDWYQSVSQGSDHILWEQDVFVPIVGGAGTRNAAFGTGVLQVGHAKADIKAKRKLQRDNQVFLAMQTTQLLGTLSKIDTIEVAGYIRALLKRPR